MNRSMHQSPSEIAAHNQRAQENRNRRSAEGEGDKGKKAVTDHLLSLPPWIYWWHQGFVFTDRTIKQPSPARLIKKRVLYAWNTLTAAHHGRLTGSPREVADLCVACRKVLEAFGLKFPSQVATGG